MLYGSFSPAPGGAIPLNCPISCWSSSHGASTDESWCTSQDPGLSWNTWGPITWCCFGYSGFEVLSSRASFVSMSVVSTTSSNRVVTLVDELGLVRSTHTPSPCGSGHTATTWLPVTTCAPRSVA